MGSTWWSADFETTSQKNLTEDGYVRVWLWSLVGVECGEEYWGTDIKSFMKTLKQLKTRVVHFHNLKFDGKFIVDYFLRNGFVYGKDFEVIIDGLGSWYEIKWYYKSDKHVIKIHDSLKKFPGTSVENLGKWIGLCKKEKPFFDRYFPLDYQPTQDEIDYCLTDSRVVAKALLSSWEQGFKGITLATDCFKFGKKLCLGGRFYRNVFPLLDPDVTDFCRNAYRGGISYLKPEYADKEINNVLVFDVNSLYPWVMHDCPLPYGYGIYTDEEPKDDLYFVSFDCEFIVKSDGFPFLQLKNTPRYMNNEFITHSDGVEHLTLTSVDYKNFKQEYHVYNECNHKYLKFQSQVGLLAPHVDYWMTRKKEYEKQGLPFMRYIAKTMMNGFYGKTALRTTRENVIPHMDEETNHVSYADKVSSEIDAVYVPYGAFVTAWARDKLINSAKQVWEQFVYCDTDSIHVIDNGQPIPLDIHQTDLGKWKNETLDGAFEYAKYIKQKTYCHARPGFDKDGNPIKEVVEIKCAGLNNDARSGIKIEDFKFGLCLKEVNLKMKTVTGGCILERCDWMLEDDRPETTIGNLERLLDGKDGTTKTVL